MSYLIRPLSPNLLEKYLVFFDRDAFADNPKWQSCYCNYLHHDPTERPWAETTASENREAASRRICAGTIQGYLAFAGEDVVGWCQAAPRLTVRDLTTLTDDDDTAARTGSIACFVVAKAHRRRGVARALLNAACEGFQRQGLEYAEAYPRENAGLDSGNHLGPLSLYLSAGFQPYRTDLDGTTIVRRALV